MKASVTVSIGRGQGSSHTMPAAMWREFREFVTTVGWAHGEVVFTGVGTGLHTDGAGVVHAEESFTCVISVDSNFRPEALRKQLRNLAAKFDQECIAMTVGATDLVEAAVVVAEVA